MQITHLSYSDFGAFENGEIDFHPKLTVFTGENGSGKSLLSLAPYAFIREKYSAGNSEMLKIAKYCRQGVGRVHASYEHQGRPIRIKYENRNTGQCEFEERGGFGENLFQPSFFEYRQRPDLPVFVYITAERGSIIRVQQDVVNSLRWREMDTATRYSKIRHLCDMVHDQDGGFDERLALALETYFPQMVRVRKVRNLPNSTERATDVVSLGMRHEVGAVASGCLEILFIVAETFGLRDSVIVIDEPELHLHPRAQVMMQKYLVHLTSEAGGQNQVVIGTHSIPMMYSSVGRVYNLRREDGFVRPENVIEDGVANASFANAIAQMGYSRSAFIDAREIVRKFVEGGQTINSDSWYSGD